VRKELEAIATLHTIPFSSTDRIGLEETGAHIENWISPQVAL
jgi:GTP-binding protein